MKSETEDKYIIHLKKLISQTENTPLHDTGKVIIPSAVDAKIKLQAYRECLKQYENFKEAGGFW